MVPLAMSDDARIGQKLCDRYEIRRVVADGGMGRVYEGIDRQNKGIDWQKKGIDWQNKGIDWQKKKNIKKSRIVNKILFLVFSSFRLFVFSSFRLFVNYIIKNPNIFC